METKVIGFRAVNNPPDNPQLIFDLDFQDFDQFIKADGKTEGYRLKYWKPRERSLNANAYMWVLLARLSEKLSEDKPITREQLYKDYIRQSNNFTYMLVKYEKAEEIANWLEKTDTFRVVEIIGRVKVGDQISAQLRCFWGSSTYDTKQMSQLIDKIVEDCKEQGIETRPQEEIERMLKIWEESQSCRSKMSASGAELQRT